MLWKCSVKLPEYIQLFEMARLRNCHLDAKCYVSTIQPSRSAANRNFESLTKGALANTFSIVFTCHGTNFL